MKSTNKKSSSKPDKTTVVSWLSSRETLPLKHILIIKINMMLEPICVVHNYQLPTRIFPPPLFFTFVKLCSLFYQIGLTLLELSVIEQLFVH